MGDKPALGHQGNVRTTGDPAATCLPSGTANGAATRVRPSQRRKDKAAYPPARGGKGGSASEEKPQQRLTPLAGIDPQPVLKALQTGQESLRTLAAKLGVSNVGLRAWLLRETSDQYHEVITAALTQRVAESDEALEEASDPVSIARAREVARFSRMDLERRRPALYGQKALSVTVNTTNVDQTVIVSASDLLETVAAKRHGAVLPLDPDGEDSVAGL